MKNAMFFVAVLVTLLAFQVVCSAQQATVAVPGYVDSPQGYWVDTGLQVTTGTLVQCVASGSWSTGGGVRPELWAGWWWQLHDR